MATLKLKKKTGPAAPAGPKRAPVRGRSAPRKQLTLAQAQAEREARAERARTAHAPDSPPARGRAARTERPDRPDRPDRPGRPERPARPAPKDRAEQPLRAQRPDRPASPERARRDGPPMSDRSARSAAPAERSIGSGRPPARERPPARPAPAAPSARERRPLTPARPVASRTRVVATGPAESRAAPRTTSAEGERLSKRMTAMGLSSRREADDWIAAGWVRVDGRVAVLGQRVGPDVQITIDPAATQLQARQVTILLNKPVGYVSGQAEDGYQPASVLVTPANRWAGDASGIAFHPAHLRGLAPAGRLDIDSVGLLVLTQDGRVAKGLIGEDSKVEKEYLVRVACAGGPAALAAIDLGLLEQGLELDGVALKPAKVSWQNEDQLRFVLREGKKRQVRRMCEAVGLQVLGLKRVRIGRIPLGQLPPGQWRYLAPFEKF